MSQSTSTKPSQSPSTPAEIDSISTELKNLTLASISSFNTKDFTYTRTPLAQDFLTRVSPHFTAEIERVDGVLSWDDLINLWRRLADSIPNAKFEIVSASVDVFEYGRASVFVETETPVQEGVRWGRMMVFKWFRDPEGVWRHSGFTSIGGSRGNSGMVD